MEQVINTEQPVVEETVYESPTPDVATEPDLSTEQEGSLYEPLGFDVEEVSQEDQVQKLVDNYVPHGLPEVALSPDTISSVNRDVILASDNPADTYNELSTGEAVTKVSGAVDLLVHQALQDNIDTIKGAFEQIAEAKARGLKNAEEALSATQELSEIYNFELRASEVLFQNTPETESYRAATGQAYAQQVSFEKESEEFELDDDYSEFGIRQYDEQTTKSIEMAYAYADGKFTWGNATDWASVFMPLADSQALARFTNRMLDTEEFNEFEGAAAMRKMFSEVSKMSGQEKLQLVEKAINVLEEESAYSPTGDNAAVIQTVIHTTLLPALQGEDPSKLDQALIYLTNVLDTSIVLGPVASFIRGFKSVPALGGSFLRPRLKVSEHTVKDETLSALSIIDKDTAELAGIDSNEELLQAIRATVPNGMELDANQLHVIEHSLSSRGAPLTKEQKEKFSAEFARLSIEKKRQLTEKGFFYSNNQSNIVETDGGVVSNSVFLSRDDTLEDAQKKFADKFPGQKVDVVPAAKDGYYKATITELHSYGDVNKRLIEMGMYSADSLGSSLLGKWQLPESTFVKEVVQDAAWFANQAGVTQELLLKQFEPALNKLGRQEMSEYSNILKGYSGKEIPLDVMERVSPQVKEALKATKTVTDTMYVMTNLKKREQLLSKGYRSYKVDDDNMIVKPFIEREQASHLGQTVKVYNPSKKTTENVDVAEIYAEGGMIARFEKGYTVGSRDIADYVLISKASDKGISELPMNVVAYRPNYLPGLYDKQYIVSRKIKDENGKEISVAYGATDSLTEANYINESVLGGEGSVRKSREMMQEQGTDQVLEQLNSPQIFVGRRGEGLVDMHGRSAQYENPVEALVQGVRIASAQISLNSHVADMKSEFVRRFMKEGDSFPLKWEVEGYGALHREARDFHSYIRQVEGANESITANLWQNTLNSFGRILGTFAPDLSSKVKIETGMASIAKKDPTRFARTVAFYNLLAMNPVRQILMQSQQSLITAGRMPSAAAPENIWYGSQVLAASASGSDEMVKMAAKMSGNPDRFHDILYAWEHSGIKTSLSTHSFVNDIVATSGVGAKAKTDIAGRASYFGGQALETLKNVGFNTGEAANKMAAFMAGITKVEADAAKAGTKVNLRSPETLKKISDIAEDMTMYMGARAGDPAYTQGALGVATQFMSIQHKAYASVFPELLGGRRDISPAEKAKIAGTVFALYGIEGVSMAVQFDKMLNKLGDENPLDDEEQSLLKYGLMGSLVNLAVDEETNFSGSFSMLSQHALAGMASAVWTDPGRFLQSFSAMGELSVEDMVAATPFSAVVGKLVTIANNLLDAQKFELPETTDQWEVAINEVARFAPMLSNYGKMQIYNSYMASVSKSGDFLLERDGKRSLIAALFGLSHVSEVDTFDVYQEFKGIDGAISRGEGSEKNALRDAQELFKAAKKIVVMDGGFDPRSREAASEVVRMVGRHMDSSDKNDLYKQTLTNEVARLALGMEGQESILKQQVDKISTTYHQSDPQVVFDKIERLEVAVSKTNDEELKVYLKDLKKYVTNVFNNEDDE